MFEFDPLAHEYTLNGVKLQSVSDFVSPLSSLPEDDPFLEMAIEIAAERGTTCHRLIEMLLTGESVEGEYPSEYEGHMDAVRVFLSEHEIEPIAIETPRYCEALGLAGTPDLECIFDGQHAILDYKFVASVDKARVAGQLNAYRKILESGYDVYPEALYVVQFMADGKYRLYPVEICDIDFDLLMTLRNRKNRKHPRRGIA